MKIVSDASPLIFLSKIGRLQLLESHTLLIPTQVAEEILQGKAAEKPDCLAIAERLTAGQITVKPIALLQNVPFTIGAGENAAVALALREHADILLIDDKKGRKLAQLLHCQARGTLAVLIDAYREKRMTLMELKGDLQRLMAIGFRIPEDKLLSILNEVERT